jgi:hypothetical protein
MVIATVGWPFLIVAALVVAAIAVWVDSVGGISKAMDVAKEKFFEFWAFVRPVFYALWDLVKVVVTAIKDAFIWVGGVISDIWKKVFGGSGDVFTRYRDHIVEQILFIGFLFQNFTDAMASAWNRLVYLVADALLKLMKVAAPIMAAALNVTFDLDAKLAALKERSDAMRTDMRQRFEEYKKNALKVAPDAVVPDEKKTKDKMEDLGKKAGDAMKKGIKDANIDAVLFGSAESMRRLDVYLERLKGVAPAVVGAAGGAAGIARPVGVPDAAGIPGQGGGGPVEDRLTEIRDLLQNNFDGPRLNVEGADVGGLGGL